MPTLKGLRSATGGVSFDALCAAATPTNAVTTTIELNASRNNERLKMQRAIISILATK
jgi:hypothetical protein